MDLKNYLIKLNNFYFYDLSLRALKITRFIIIYKIRI